jgi:hypothetical protein
LIRIGGSSTVADCISRLSPRDFRQASIARHIARTAKTTSNNVRNRAVATFAAIEGAVPLIDPAGKRDYKKWKWIHFHFL